MSKNYFDEHGNYMNVENLTLGEIYRRGYEDSYLKRGEWIDNHNGTYTCSACGFHHSKSNFCPKCGAYMWKG